MDTFRKAGGSEMKRKWELLLGMVGGSLSLIFFGGLAVTLSNMSASEFKKSYQSLAVDHSTCLYFITGFILLIGTQFIAFPFAFFYFAAGAFSLYRVRMRKGA